MKFTKKLEAFDLIVIILLGFVFIVCFFPIMHIFSVSISHPQEVQKGISILPRGITLFAYQYMLNSDYMLGSFINSIKYTSFGVAISLMMTVMAAYPLSKKRLVGYRTLNFMIVLTYYFNGGLIPTYLLVSSLKLRNTMWALILPGAIMAFNFIVMRTFFADLPNELEESAKIDGAGTLGILLRIVIPLSKPILAAVGIFCGVMYWNDYFHAIIYLDVYNKYPVTVILKEVVMGTLLSDKMLSDNNAIMNDVIKGSREDLVSYSQSFKYALIFISIMPILIAYPFVQRYFVKGMMVGAIKG